jgi:hypothetical protein
MMPHMAIWKSSTSRQNRTKEEGGEEEAEGRLKWVIHSIVSL